MTNSQNSDNDDITYLSGQNTDAFEGDDNSASGA